MESQQVKPALQVVKLDRVRAARAVGRGVEPGSMNEAFQVYKATPHWQTRAHKTREMYALVMRLALAKLPQKFEAPDVEDWMAWMVNTRGNSHATANSNRRALASILEQAARRTHDHRLSDAVKCAQKFPEPERRKRCPPHDAFARALAVCRDKAEMLFVRLAAVHALRKGEIVGLMPGDLTETDVLTVERQREGLRVGPRKNKSRLTMPLDRETATLFRWCANNSHEVRSKQGWHRGGGHGFVIPWSEKRIANFMGRIRAELGDDAEEYFPRGTAWHAFRHLSASVTSRETRGDLMRIKNKLGDKSEAVAMLYVAEGRGALESNDGDLVARALDRARQMVLAPVPSKGGRAVVTATARPSVGADSQPHSTQARRLGDSDGVGVTIGEVTVSTNPGDET